MLNPDKSGVIQNPLSPLPIEVLNGNGRSFGRSDEMLVSGQRSEPWTIALIDEHEFTRCCVATCLKLVCPDIEVAEFRRISDLTVAQVERFHLIVYHAHGATVKGGVGHSFTALMLEKLTPPVLVVSDVDDLDTIIEALGAGVRGYVPTVNTNLRVTIEVMRLVSAGGVFAPMAASLLQQARDAGPTEPSMDTFTTRQLDVLERLKAGSANKVIAHELSMSEGTVKVHIRNIMKKLHASNRTQAVLRAYNPHFEK
jgi:DNA-binding NarL/FixJ family response regulator